MLIGLTYDLRSDHVPQDHLSTDYYGDLDSPETLSSLEDAIRQLGYDCIRIGGVDKLVKFLAAGQRVDLVFNIAEGLHSRSRESQVPALLDAFAIPYTFSDAVTNAVCLDKGLTKRLLQHAGLPTSPFHVVRRPADLDAIYDNGLAFPLFAKPVHEGTSKGIHETSVVESFDQLRAVVEALLRAYQQPVLVEQFLSGREFTIGILGNGENARVIGAVEIKLVSPSDQVYSFENKEAYETAVQHTPVTEEPLLSQMASLALRAYQVLECRDAARIDIRLDGYGQPYILEINTLPGLHPTQSDLPLIAAQAGMTYPRLIQEIITSAISRQMTVLGYGGGAAVYDKPLDFR